MTCRNSSPGLGLGIIPRLSLDLVIDEWQVHTIYWVRL